MQGISIIVPLFNKENTITSTIDSILGLPDKCKKEVIIIDDGSKDNSFSVAKTFLPNVTVSEQKNQGPSAARNHGARLATYSNLIFLDADDELKPGCLDEHILMREISEPAGKVNLSFVSFEIEHHDDGRIQTVDLTDRFKGKGSCFKFSEFDFNFIAFVHSGCFCIDRSLFLDVGGYDESLQIMEITDFLSRVFLENPISAVSSSILSKKNEEAFESQFDRASKNPEQLLLFGERLIGIMNRVNLAQKHLLSKELIFTINKLWLSKQYRCASALLREYEPLRSKHSLRRPSIKIMALSSIFLPFS